MKFKVGDEEYENIDSARVGFCLGRSAKCQKCPISARNNGTHFGCRIFVRTHQKEAAKLMGLEIEENDDEEIFNET